MAAVGCSARAIAVAGRTARLGASGLGIRAGSVIRARARCYIACSARAEAVGVAAVTIDTIVVLAFVGLGASGRRRFFACSSI